MPVWKTAPVAEQPAIVLSPWDVISVPAPEGGERNHHLVGCEPGGNGRVSSFIVAFDQKSMVATTRSGRKYHLSGCFGSSQNSYYVLQKWLNINGLKPEDAQSVSRQYLPGR